MKKVTILSLSLLLSTVLLAQKYMVNVNLNNVVDDRVQVIYTLPNVSQERIEFRMPKIVPGTYSIYDFGRFAQDFKALDVDGNELKVDSITANRRLINNATTLSKISYWIEDTYDTEQDNVIFEPAGVNIEEGENYIINTFGAIGYLEGMKNLPYEVSFQKPVVMFGASALKKEIKNDSLDVFYTDNYFDLADGPIMYCAPDTATFEVGGAEILVSIYSPNDVLKSTFIKDQVTPTLEAQKVYMGDELPVDKYAFLIYLTPNPTLSGGMGALEHSYSSFYVLPEANPEYLGQIVRDVAAHEFFHIVTPLNIHSEEIGDFDFINPKMSKHLWLYEGMTEYAAGLAQVKYGELTFEKYLSEMNGKVDASMKFKDDLPFTEMSLGCLDEYEDQYGNVYQKGALIGMSLDIKLRELSGGSYGVEQMMIDLSKKYGVSTSFKDDELFETIVEMTYPEIRTFFSKYVEGATPIPYGDFLNQVGISYNKGDSAKELSLGHIGLGVGDDSRIAITSIESMNAFGVEMKYQEGDVFIELNGEDINMANYKDVINNFKENNAEGDIVTALVMRTDAKGKKKKKKLKAHALNVDVISKASLELMENPTSEQLALRKAWVNQ